MIIPYDQLFNEVPCFVSVQDRQYRIVEANRRFKDAFGDKVGEYCWTIYKHRSDRCPVCPVAETFRDGAVHCSEEIVTDLDGRIINTLVYTSPVKDTDGAITAVMEMSTDITEIRRLQSQLTSVGQLVAGLAHTVKGIVMGLDGGIYVVDSGFKRKNEEVVRKGWDMVQRNVERVSRLVLDMLYYAKDRAPEWCKLNLTQLVEDVCQLYQKKLADNVIELVKDMQAVAVIEADKSSIHGLCLNLMDNAIDACRWDSGKKEHQISWTVRKDGMAAEMVITDNGMGMDEETRVRLFTPLFSTKGGSGTGLGLLVARKVVEEHGGTITVESAVGEGARFTVRIPLKK
jgi:PAS domain S-box-containing protein